MGAAYAQQIDLSNQTWSTEVIRKSGQAVIPLYDGWYPNEDGSKTICFGYFNMNSEQALDIPLGDENYLETDYPGLDLSTANIPTHFMKIATRTNHWTIVNVVALTASATLWFPFLVATSETWRLLGAFPDVSNAHLVLFASPRFWLAVALGAGTAAAADLAAANARRALRPSLAEVVRERESITSAPTNAITQRVAKALVASASTTMRAVASFVCVSRRGGGGGGSRGGLPVSARRAGGGGSWKSACARRKSRNPSVLEVVKQHRNYSDDWNA